MDIIDILKGLYPGHDFALLYDQSSGHGKRRPGALNASLLNVGFGGSQPARLQPATNPSELAEDMFGDFTGNDYVKANGLLKPGDVQVFQYPSGSLDPVKDGPKKFTPQERQDRQYPCEQEPKPPKKKTAKELSKELIEKGKIQQGERYSIKNLRVLALQCDPPIPIEHEKKPKLKTKPDLFRELREKGKIRENRGYKVEELREIAKACDPPIQIELENQDEPPLPGWDGAQKGMWQLCFETGHIEPDRKEFYSKKELRKILSSRRDFAEEITALEWIAAEMSDDSCTVQVIFSPKYHCEIAGEGIEMCWGFIKKYYRRKFSLQQKKRHFKHCVKKALHSIPKTTVRKYAGHVYAYMMGYRAMKEQGAEYSYSEIEKFMKKYKCHRSSGDQESGRIDADVKNALAKKKMLSK